MASVAVRTPYESFFASNSKEDQRSILSSALRFVVKDLDDSGVNFAYHLSPQKKEKITSLGVSLHPTPFLAHSHPFCKTVENYMLLNVLPGLMGNGKWIFSSIKKKKIDTIIKRRGVQASNIDFVNKVICAKDFGRYDFDPKVHDIRVNTGSKDFIFPRSYLKSLRHNKVFIHDEVHHWSLNDMIYFLNEVEPKILTFTVVYPPELIKGIVQPQNPNLYKFEVCNKTKKLFFFPDGCKGEAYEQPIRLDWLFEASHIDTGEQMYTVKLIRSAYAHHMFQIIPGEYLTDSKRFFSDFETIDLSVMHENRFRYYDYIPIKMTHIQKVYSYLLCLKKPDVESGLAKLRQMFEDEQDCRVVEFFSKFCKDVISKHKGVWDMYGISLLDLMKDKFISAFPLSIARNFKMWEKKNIFDFLFTLGTLTVVVETKVVRKTFVSNLFEAFVERCAVDEQISDIADRLWTGAPKEKKKFHVIRVMKSHDFDEIIKPSIRRISILLFLHIIRNRRKEFEGNLFLPFSSNGPFFPPKWYVDELAKKEEEERREKEREEGILLEEVRVDFSCHGWYVKVDLSTIVTRHEIDEDYVLDAGRTPGVCIEEEFGKKEKKIKKNEVQEQISGPICDSERSVFFGDEACKGEIITLNTCSEETVNSKPRHNVINGGYIVDVDICEDSVSSRRIRKVIGDGNCFFRCLRVSFGLDEDSYMITKKKIAELMKKCESLDIDSELIVDTETDCVFVDDEAAKIIVYLLNIELRVSTKGKLSSYSRFVPKMNAGLVNERRVVHMHLEHLHFDLVVENCEDEILCPFNVCFFDTSIINNGLAKENFRGTNIGGEVITMLVNNYDSDMKMDGVRMKQNLFDIDCILPDMFCGRFNVCFIRAHKKDTENFLFSANESAFDGSKEQNLFINVCGVAIVSWQNQGKTKSIRMEPGTAFEIERNEDSRSIKVLYLCDNGLSAFMRNQVRSMDGSPVRDFGKLLMSMKNKCLVEAIAKNERRNAFMIISALFKKDEPFWSKWVRDDNESEVSFLIKAANDLNFSFEIEIDGEVKEYRNSGPLFSFRLKNSHFEMAEIDKVGKVMTELERRMSINENVSDVGEMLVNSIKIQKGYNSLKFKSDDEYAMKLISSFKNRTTGISLSDIYSNGDSIFKDAIENLSKRTSSQPSAFEGQHGFDIHCLIGFGGSGKSNSVQSFLRSNKKKRFMVISPRSNLCEDWKFKVGCSEKKIRTFETALRVDFKRVDLIILDEMSLFPNGYLDLVLTMLGAKRAKEVKIVCIFDIYQARYHSDMDVNVLGERHDIDRMVESVNIKYLYQSHRILSSFFDFFWKGLAVRKESEEGFGLRVYECHLKAQLIEESEGRPFEAILVASRDEKRALSGKVQTMTFGESQGLTFNRVAIVLSENSEKQDEFRWMVALTRSRISVCFICIYRGGISSFVQNCGNKLIGCFLKGQECTERRLKLMSCAKDVTFEKEPRGGRVDEVDREERLEGDPFLKPFIFLGQRVNSDDVEVVEVECVEPKGKAHLCISQENFAQSRNFDLIRSKDLREYRFRDSCTDQFSDNYERVGGNSIKHTAGPLRFESIYPRHKADDDLTFWMAVQKRLRFSNEAKERAKLKDSSAIGQLLYYNLKEKLGLNFSSDPQLLEACINEFETKKLSKSKATIANHSIRSNNDWPMNEIFLFMKSQLCTKFEKQYCDAKAGQTLACFQHMVLVKFAPYCRYMETMIRRQLPEEIYIHSNKNFNDLNDWVKKFFKNDTCVESDYEAFDASQDEYIVSFEIALMEDMGMPNWLINEYVDLKCTLGCKLGHFAIMRFTGEFCTFLFNTLANMAFTMCRYNWRRGQPIAFAGDDMCALNNLEVSDKFDTIFEKLSLRAKVIRTDCPMFCGWRLSKYGIVKEPELVYNRFMIAKERGNIDECLENYAIEVSYAYSLGERLFEVLKSEEQIEYHQSVVRFIVQRLSKIQTKVRDLFSEQEDV